MTRLVLPVFELQRRGREVLIGPASAPQKSTRG